MKQNPAYILKNIFNEYYLIPFGPAIESRSRAVRVNDAAAFIWNKLAECSDIPVLADKLSEEYGIPKAEAALIRQDIRAVLLDFVKEGVVLQEPPAGFHPSSKPVFHKMNFNTLSDEGTSHILNIAGLRIRICCRDRFFSKDFMTFTSDSADTAPVSDDIRVTVTEQSPPKTGILPITVKGAAVTICDAGDYYSVRSLELPNMRQAYVSKDGSHAILYMDLSTNAQKLFFTPFSGTVSKSPDESVFGFTRLPFLLKAQSLDMYAIHSASILYNGKAYVFSAPSGTGKSTHTNIWNRLYGTPVLNGDLNLLAFEDGRPVVKGIPWCGTSGICTAGSYPLGGIIFLAQSDSNYIEDYTPAAKALNVHMRFITPKWTAQQTSLSIDFAMRIAHVAKIACLHCNMDDDAAGVCKAWIDSEPTIYKA